MTGVFQLFDRQRFSTGCGGTIEADSSYIYNRSAVTEKHSNKNVQEKQRVSTESSRASFSSSYSSSSFSSVDCNKISRPEYASFNRTILPETPSRDPAMSQSSAFPQFERQSLDLRDMVKDSMYREARGLSAADSVVKHRDSPRPRQLSKTYDRSYSMGLSGKPNLPVDLEESLRVLAKLREAPLYFNEPRELTRSSSYQSKDGSLFSTPKDAPRFSYDGREINRLSFESWDTSKSILKLEDLPRLSLDSREASTCSLFSDSKSNFVSRNSEKYCDNSNDKVTSLQQTSGNQTRPLSVVAKLMGLETLPDSFSASASKVNTIRSRSVVDSDPFSRSSTATDLGGPIRIPNSSRNSWKEPTFPRWRSPDSVMQPISMLPVEPAPWKELDRTRDSQKRASRSPEALAKSPIPIPSLHGEIEKILKDLEFTRSGKDLRALKQILETMQTKRLLETRKGQDSNFATPNDHEQRFTSSPQITKVVNQRKPPSDHGITSVNKRYSSLRTFESPIVIRKAATLLAKYGKRQGGDFAVNRSSSANSRTAKDPIPNISRKDNAVNSADMKSNGKNIRSAETSTRPQQLPKESTTSSGSISPRMQQKQLELVKRSSPPTLPSDSSKPRRQSNKQQPDSSSPGGRRRPISSNLQRSEDQPSEISCETRTLSYQENDIFLQSDVDIVSDSKKSTLTLSEDESAVELPIVATEYLSPVSILDKAACIDDSPSPVKHMPKVLKDVGTRNADNIFTEAQWSTTDNFVSDAMGSGLTSEIYRKKLRDIDHLVQKLRKLNSSHDETRTDYIASLCENTNPDHRYISEILLASGILLRDLGSIEFHLSGHPINPELFLVLEQIKASKGKCSLEQVVESKQKIHRKLVFDAVNEILIGKLAARKSLNAQKLLKELCLEIEHIQAMKSEWNLEEGDDGLKSIVSDDVTRRSERWTDFNGETSGLILDVERLIFKDLVNEIL